MSTITLQKLSLEIKNWGKALGFSQIGMTDCDLTTASQHLTQWLRKGFHGEMHYMENHASLRKNPQQLLPETVRIISARMDYMPPNTRKAQRLKEQQKGYISRYALGRDYHKLMRKRLEKLAKKISEHLPHQYRAFTDSAPVLERAIAEKSGLGWIGKNTLVINKKAGSYFFLGEIYTSAPLPIDQPASFHCGSCSSCIDICPTKAIVAPFQLDARRCISYLTIELDGSIPIEFRKAIGNRIFGCDDCQLCCPWNKFSQYTAEDDFHPRYQLDNSTLIELFNWSEEEFLQKTQGSAIRRTGYINWLRNIAVALGNAPSSTAIINTLRNKQSYDNIVVKEHVAWALTQHEN